MRAQSVSLFLCRIGSLTVVAILLAAAPAAAADLRWQAVTPEVPVGKGVRVEVRLVEGDAGTAVEKVTVTAVRLDMGPDGMAMMVAPLKPVAASVPGGIAYETDLIMAGRWAMTITGTVKGLATPVTGTVIFNAVEKKAEAAPAAQPGDRTILYYRNPMGLADVSPVPKKDSMGMDYIPVYEDESKAPAGTVRISVDKVQRAGVRTAEVTRRTVSRTVRGVGTVVADESRLAVVTAKFDGFVEEMLVRVAGAEVRTGTPLMRVWIESPEILQKVADYLVALRATPPRPGDVQRTEQNLRLFGIPNRSIEQLRQSGEAVRSIVLAASANGTVMEKPAVDGMRFAAGDTLFKTADLSTVWVIAQVSERDLGLVRVGQPVQVSLRAFPEPPREGRVVFIYPELDMATRTARVRIELPNPDGRIKLGMYAGVDIDTRSDGKPVVAVPESAIIDSGSRRVAFVARDEGTFEPRHLTLGRRGDGFVEVRDGLAEGERIVVTGNFLIDAESNLRAALSAFGAHESHK